MCDDAVAWSAGGLGTAHKLDVRGLPGGRFYRLFYNCQAA